MIHTSKLEIQELVKAWLAISIAFTILLGYGALGEDLPLGHVFILSLLTVGLGFLLHELAHKFTAQYYNCHAEFRADNGMLALAIGMSFFGFVFAAPGAVMIQGFITYRENGIISVAGPITNILLAILFIPIILIGGIAGIIGFYGFLINSWLGLFNMIPVWNLDGAKVLKWNKTIYISVTAILLIMTLSTFLI